MSDGMPVLLAHGALGPFDEIIFIGIGVIFVVMMGISWLRSQELGEDESDGVEANEGERFELH